jgi:hypothetical protein
MFGHVGTARTVIISCENVGRAFGVEDSVHISRTHEATFG